VGGKHGGPPPPKHGGQIDGVLHESMMPLPQSDAPQAGACETTSGPHVPPPGLASTVPASVGSGWGPASPRVGFPELMPEPGFTMLPEATTLPEPGTDPDEVPEPCDPDAVPEPCAIPDVLPEPGVAPAETDPAEESPDAAPVDDPLDGDPVDAPEPVTEKACPPQ
jgi:hypothetical protein